MSAAAIEPPPGLAWVVCFGATLPVLGGRVSCPLQDGTVPVGDCLDCRHLSAAADERTPDRDCRILDSIS